MEGKGLAATATYLTPCVTQLVMLRDDIELGRATGFFLKVDGTWFLVSNWHVFSGCRCDTGQPRHLHGAVPNRCIFFQSELFDAGIKWNPISIALGEAIEGGANWFQHPSMGQEIDIAAIPLDADHVGRSKDLLEAGANDPEMFIDLGGDLFLPGYPLGLTGGGQFPIWKRASLASSLEWGPGVNQMFYVDTASREGMSGSPCLAISNWKHYRLDRKTGKMGVIRVPLSWRLMGVYSGRLNAKDDLGAQIGIVWRDHLIIDVVKGRAPGEVKIPLPVR